MSEKPLPDKCQHCGLRVRYDFRSAGESMTSDQAFSELVRLREAGIVPVRYRRRVNCSSIPGDYGSTEIYAVASNSWLRPNISCSHWVLRIEGASVADYLAIHNTRLSYRFAAGAAIIGGLLAIVLAILGAGG